jgi:secondary thiamine-phosphate synthase enzyme
MWKQESFIQKTNKGRGSYELTDLIQKIVADASVHTGLCHIFVHHTSASLMLCENADPSVRRDLDAFLERLVPDGDPAYEHSYEGEDDMAAHIRTVLTQSGLTIPVNKGRCDLGTWQGVYLLEHRYGAHQRRVTVTVQGE